MACLLSLPVSFAVESLIGRLGFLAPLPFVVSLPAMLAWLSLSAVFSLLSSWLPARRAAAISVREALVELWAHAAAGVVASQAQDGQVSDHWLSHRRSQALDYGAGRVHP